MQEKLGGGRSEYEKDRLTTGILPGIWRSESSFVAPLSHYMFNKS